MANLSLLPPFRYCIVAQSHKGVDYFWHQPSELFVDGAHASVYDKKPSDEEVKRAEDTLQGPPRLWREVRARRVNVDITVFRPHATTHPGVRGNSPVDESASQPWHDDAGLNPQFHE